MAADEEVIAPSAAEPVLKEEAQEEKNAAPETFAREVGIIEPPPDIKTIIERTADFVRRVGSAFEKEIQARNAKTKTFGFLYPTSPYHAYYQQRLQFGAAVPTATENTPDAPIDTKGNLIADQSKAEEEEKQRQLKAQEAAKPKVKKTKTLKDRMKDYVKSAKTVKLIPTEAPPSDAYSVRAPSMFSAADIEVIKLTSMFVARNGRTFLSGLTAREQRNPQFDFLKPNHPLFSFFQQLVDAYAQIIIPPKQLLSRIKDSSHDTTKILDEALSRAKYQKMQQEAEIKEKQNEENERVAMALIDWHQFVVVETINFDRGEEDYLPAPKKNIQEIAYMLDAQEVSAQESGGAGEDMDMDMDMDMDDEEEKEGEPKDDEDGEGAEAEPAPEPEPEGELVTVYDPPDEIRGSSIDASSRFQKCPICLELIAVDEISEHMRIELLDPKWKEQKSAWQHKTNASSYADSSQIGANLTDFARRRADVFVGKNEAESEKIQNQREKQAMARYDQHRKALAQENAEKAAQPKAMPSAPAPTPLSVRPTLAQQAAAAGARPTMPAPAVPMAAPLIPAARPMPPPGPPPGAPTAILPQPTPAAPVGAPPGPSVGAPARPPAAALPAQPVLGQPPLMMARPGMPIMPMYPGMMQPGILQPPMPGIAARPGMPAMPVPPAAGMPGPDEPAAKKARFEAATASLVPEAMWMAQTPPRFSVRVTVPGDLAEFNCSGQTHEITCNIGDTVEAFKQQLSASCNNMPTGKMKVSFTATGIFLNKDNASLAFYNVGPGAQLQLGIRERGGRKK